MLYSCYIYVYVLMPFYVLVCFVANCLPILIIVVKLALTIDDSCMVIFVIYHCW